MRGILKAFFGRFSHAFHGLSTIHIFSGRLLTDFTDRFMRSFAALFQGLLRLGCAVFSEVNVTKHFNRASICHKSIYSRCFPNSYPYAPYQVSSQSLKFRERSKSTMSLIDDR